MQKFIIAGFGVCVGACVIKVAYLIEQNKKSQGQIDNLRALLNECDKALDKED